MVGRFECALRSIIDFSKKEGIAWAQRKLKVLVLYLFFRGDRYGYKGIKYAFIFS